jgi:uncharacterized membrane protein YcaP (DUF421 family)
MSGFASPDWVGVFIPDASLFESFVRGTVVYFAVLAMMRFARKRQLGSIGLTDVLLLVLISECVSQALNAKANSVANGVAAVAALLFWDFVLDWAGYRSKWVRRILEHKPVPLVTDGRPLAEHMKAERITQDELDSCLRMNGVGDLSRVKCARLESNGEMSVVRRDTGPQEAETAHHPSDYAAALETFLAAARHLRAAVEWHDEQSREHAEAAKVARAALTRNGIVGRKLLGETERREAARDRNGHA